MPENQPGFLQRMLCHPRQPPPEQLQPCRLPVPSHPSCPALRCEPAASSAGAGRAGRPQARAAAGRVAAGWHGVGGRSRWKRPFDFLSPRYRQSCSRKRNEG